MLEACVSCGEEFIWERGKPGLRKECWACGIRTERERGVKKVLAERYVPAYGASRAVARIVGSLSALGEAHDAREAARYHPPRRHFWKPGR